jgi:hypothetical protein
MMRKAKLIFTECYRLARVGVLQRTALQLFAPAIVNAAYHAHSQYKVPVRVTRQFQYKALFGKPGQLKKKLNIYESMPVYAHRIWVALPSPLTLNAKMFRAQQNRYHMMCYYAKDIPTVT